MAPDVREQRLVFGEDAELYEKARAGYPESLVDDVLAFVGFDASPVRALEVGAGTGKATRSVRRTTAASGSKTSTCAGRLPSRGTRR